MRQPAVKKPASNPFKRTKPPGNPGPLPPSKRAKTAFISGSPAQKKNGVVRAPSLVPAVGGRKPQTVNNSSVGPRNGAAPSPQQQQPPKAGGQIKRMPPGNPVSWKYRQLPENLYNADIKKTDLLKDHEAMECLCKTPANEEDFACADSGCINRSTFTECEKEVCPHGGRCSNQRLQRRQYAPGLERFMTQKKGWGVRARQSIPSGNLILEYMGEMCTSGEFEKRMMTRYKGDTHHYCLAVDSKTLIDAQRAGSECRFVNHSCDPNCEMQKWNVCGLTRMAVFAKRDILPGEEITYDYNFSLFDRNQGQVCKCGAKECRGVIGGKGKDYLIKVDANKKTLVSASPESVIAADTKFFATKISSADFAWIKSNAPSQAQLEHRQVKCTICNACIDFRIRGAAQRHPELGVVLCATCGQNYGKGGWARDQQGSDEFCRWCSEGGQIYLCDFCPKAFCHKCIKWNLGKKYLTKIDQEEKWKCLGCDGSLLRPARALYYGIHCYHKSISSNTAAANTPTVKSSKATPKRVQAQTGKQQSKPAPIQNGQKPGTSVQSNKGAKGAVVQAQQPRHYVDSMLLEADRACNKMRSMINETRRVWAQAGIGRTRNEKTVNDMVKRIQKLLADSISGINTADSKILNIQKVNTKAPAKSRAGRKPSPKKSQEVKSSKDEILDVSIDELEPNGHSDQNVVPTIDSEEYAPIEVDVDIDENVTAEEVTNGKDDNDKIEIVEEVQQETKVNGKMETEELNSENEVTIDDNENIDTVEKKSDNCPEDKPNQSSEENSQGDDIEVAKDDKSDDKSQIEEIEVKEENDIKTEVDIKEELINNEENEVVDINEGDEVDANEKNEYVREENEIDTKEGRIGNDIDIREDCDDDAIEENDADSREQKENGEINGRKDDIIVEEEDGEEENDDVTEENKDESEEIEDNRTPESKVEEREMNKDNVIEENIKKANENDPTEENEHNLTEADDVKEENEHNVTEADENDVREENEDDVIEENEDVEIEENDNVVIEENVNEVTEANSDDITEVNANDRREENEDNVRKGNQNYPPVESVDKEVIKDTDVEEIELLDESDEVRSVENMNLLGHFNHPTRAISEKEESTENKINEENNLEAQNEVAIINGSDNTDSNEIVLDSEISKSQQSEFYNEHFSDTCKDNQNSADYVYSEDIENIEENAAIVGENTSEVVYAIEDIESRDNIEALHDFRKENESSWNVLAVRDSERFMKALISEEDQDMDDDDSLVVQTV